MHIFLVGPSTKAHRNYLTTLGYSYTRFIDRTQTKFPDVALENRVVTDFSDESVYFADVDNINAQKPVNGVMTTYENSILHAAIIAERLGLPGLPVESAKACTDKFLMRTLFSKAPEPISPDFAVVSNEQEVLGFADNHDFPLILKPANLAKSLLVTKNHNKEELIRNYAKAVSDMPAVYKRYSPHRSPKLIIEEFMTGSIHSVDAFVDASGTPHILDAIVDYQTGYDVGYDDNFHYSRIMPSKLTVPQQDSLKHVAELGCRALGMKNSAAHIEIIMTTTGPKIVEIGARNGGYRERMHRLANGLDLQGAALEIAFGRKPDTTITRHEPCAVLELFPMTPGKFLRLAGEDEARKLASFIQCNVHAKPGQIVGKSSDGFKMCAMILLQNSNPEQFDKDLSWVNQNLKVDTSR